MAACHGAWHGRVSRLRVTAACHGRVSRPRAMATGGRTAACHGRVSRSRACPPSSLIDQSNARKASKSKALREAPTSRLRELTLTLPSPNRAAAAALTLSASLDADVAGSLVE